MTLEQCFPVGCIYKILTDSRSRTYGVTDDVITYNLCRNFGLNISETTPDSGMVTTDSLYKLSYGLSIAHAPDDVT